MGGMTASGWEHGTRGRWDLCFPGGSRRPPCSRKIPSCAFDPTDLYYGCGLVIDDIPAKRVMLMRGIIISLWESRESNRPGGFRPCTGVDDPGKLGKTTTACNEVGEKHAIFMRRALLDLDITFSSLVWIITFDILRIRGPISDINDH